MTDGLEIMEASKIFELLSECMDVNDVSLDFTAITGLCMFLVSASFDLCVTSEQLNQVIDILYKDMERQINEN